MEQEAFESLMASLVRDDDNRLSPGDVSTAAALVIKRYNADRPRELTRMCWLAPGWWFKHLITG